MLVCAAIPVQWEQHVLLLQRYIAFLPYLVTNFCCCCLQAAIKQAVLGERAMIEHLRLLGM